MSTVALYPSRRELGVDALLAVDGEPWDTADEHVIPLEPTPLESQPSAYVQTAYADRKKGRITEVRVKAVLAGSSLGLRLDWKAPRAHRAITDVNVYPDACAVMFPENGREADVATMGSPEQPVVVWHWRAGEDEPFLVRATGLGSASRQPLAGLRASSAWRDGRWRVVLVREGAVTNGSSPLPVSFAIWSGEDEERAGLKSHAPAFHELHIA